MRFEKCEEFCVFYIAEPFCTVIPHLVSGAVVNTTVCDRNFSRSLLLQHCTIDAPRYFFLVFLTKVSWTNETGTRQKLIQTIRECGKTKSYFLAMVMHNIFFTRSIFSVDFQNDLLSTKGCWRQM